MSATHDQGECRRQVYFCTVFGLREEKRSACSPDFISKPVQGYSSDGEYADTSGQRSVPTQLVGEESGSLIQWSQP